jgi:hypothetical protein
VKIGVMVTGEVAVRAALSLSAHPGIDEVVVIGPATSRTFPVVTDASGCDLLIGTGGEAPRRARSLGVPLVWDGEAHEDGVIVHGASAEGLALAVAARESDPRLVALAHPDLPEGTGGRAEFPQPVGRLTVSDRAYGGRRLAGGRSTNGYAAVLTVGRMRRVAVVDDARFLSGVALAAGVAVVEDEPVAVWDSALTYLRAATGMGLVMAEESVGSR